MNVETAVERKDLIIWCTTVAALPLDGRRLMAGFLLLSKLVSTAGLLAVGFVASRWLRSRSLKLAMESLVSPPGVR